MSRSPTRLRSSALRCPNSPTTMCMARLERHRSRVQVGRGQRNAMFLASLHADFRHGPELVFQIHFRPKSRPSLRPSAPPSGSRSLRPAQSSLLRPAGGSETLVSQRRALRYGDREPASFSSPGGAEGAPPIYGPRKTLYNRFQRWSAKGVWSAIFHALANAGGPPAELLIDSSAVRA